MTYQGVFTLPTELLEQIAIHGFDQLPGLIRIVVNAAMQAKRQQYLGAAPYQRTPERQAVWIKPHSELKAQRPSLPNVYPRQAIFYQHSVKNAPGALPALSLCRSRICGEPVAIQNLDS